MYIVLKMSLGVRVVTAIDKAMHQEVLQAVQNIR